jgi:predicted enzyme related to lactoylglutathione lyase
MVKINMQYNSIIITIATVNFDNIVSFYTQLLGQKPKKLIPHIYAEFQISGLKLGIFKPKSANEPEFVTYVQSPLSLCLEVNNLETAISHLTSLGCTPPGAISTASHGQEIYAYDPDGNRLILHQSHQEGIENREQGTGNREQANIITTNN